MDAKEALQKLNAAHMSSIAVNNPSSVVIVLEMALSYSILHEHIDVRIEQCGQVRQTHCGRELCVVIKRSSHSCVMAVRCVCSNGMKPDIELPYSTLCM